VQAAIDRAVTHYGRLDILVNNAGIGSCTSVLDMSLDEWERNLRVNLAGTFLCAQAAARVMVRQGGGRIVNIASISGSPDISHFEGAIRRSVVAEPAFGGRALARRRRVSTNPGRESLTASATL
jgi:NAD(P)-dependent dehydrogenase (short-subunit alcohol dehydrogenase family)